MLQISKLAKHIIIKYHHIRSLYEQGCIEPECVNTKEQIADGLTKDHSRICRECMVLSKRMSQIQATKVADLVDIRLLVTENNYGFNPWNLQAA